MFCVFAVVQSAIMTAIVVLRKGAPIKGAMLLGDGKFNASIELFVTVAATRVALALPVIGRVGLDQLSWLTPARCGYAASASTVGLPCPHYTPPPPCPGPNVPHVIPEHSSECLIPPSLSPQNSHWQHTPGA